MVPEFRFQYFHLRISRHQSYNLRDYLMCLTKLHLRPIALAKEGISDSAIRRVLFEAKRAST